MKIITWDPDKNAFLKKERGISFEVISLYIEQNEVLDIVDHPNKEQYGHQRMFILQIGNYIYAVPFVEDEKTIFLKTAFPSRKWKKQYEENSDEQT